MHSDNLIVPNYVYLFMPCSTQLEIVQKLNANFFLLSTSTHDHIWWNK